jgi:diguanylate cyclase (GGDEF)-like protein
MLLAMAKERTEFRHKTAAMVDPLTGIANRRAFLQEAGERAMRQPADAQATAVLLMDLDNFKSINDRFGHAIGDRVLQIFCETASDQVRPIDLVGRLGGEEFAAVLCDVGRERAMVLAERLRSSFAEAAVEVDGCQVGATVSIGMVLAQGAPVEIASLLAQADQALYCAKEAGKNRVEVASLDFIRKRNLEGSSGELAGAKTAA